MMSSAAGVGAPLTAVTMSPGLIPDLSAGVPGLAADLPLQRRRSLDVCDRPEGEDRESNVCEWTGRNGAGTGTKRGVKESSPFLGLGHSGHCLVRHLAGGVLVACELDVAAEGYQADPPLRPFPVSSCP